MARDKSIMSAAFSNGKAFCPSCASSVRVVERLARVVKTPEGNGFAPPSYLLNCKNCGFNGQIITPAIWFYKGDLNG